MDIVLITSTTNTMFGCSIPNKQFLQNLMTKATVMNHVGHSLKAQTYLSESSQISVISQFDYLKRRVVLAHPELWLGPFPVAFFYYSYLNQNKPYRKLNSVLSKFYLLLVVWLLAGSTLFSKTRITGKRHTLRELSESEFKVLIKNEAKIESDAKMQFEI